MSRDKVFIFIFSLISAINCEVLEIDDGKLEGIKLMTRKGVDYYAVFKIPYAEPPVGALRFQPPLQNKKWDGIIDGTKYGPMCIQTPRDFHEFGMSEDCLHLNVFTKDIDSKAIKPVIVYIHGGGFECGTSSDYKPDYLLDRDIVLVTINYRLGPFGFLATGTKDAPGNMGLKDQVMALKWVQRNIKFFGGNPELVTITGLSAGGYSVTAHMTSEMSKGLFHKVIAMSGAITWQIGLKNNGLDNAKELGNRLNCSENLSDMVMCLIEKPAEEIASFASKSFYGCPIMPYVPVIEPDFGQERFFTEDPNETFKTGNFSKVPVMIGITTDEFIQPVKSLLNNDDTLRVLNDDFSAIAPECFFFKGNAYKTTEAIAEILKNYYFPFETITRASFNSLNLLIADGVTGYNIHRFVHFVSSANDLYYYKFSYNGRYSIFNYPRNKPYGVHHGDDNQYLFYNSYISPLVTESDPENFMVERMTRIWEQFAKYGDPNDEKDEYLTEMNWPKHDLENEYYLDIGRDMVEKQGLYLERYSVWDNLEKSSTSIVKLGVWMLGMSIIAAIKTF